uniref:Putative transcription termination factor rho n=1 Tax=Anopheles braziliensis TaxID=58242 RepID=A0A2M3Z070_9DIPT
MDPPELKNATAVKEDISMEESGSWTILGNRPTSEESSGVQIVESDSEKEDQEPAVVAQGEISTKSRWNAESQLDESSDGISVISESDITSGDKIVDQEEDGAPTLHFTETLNLRSTYEPLTPPYTPTSASTAHEEFKEKSLQVQQTGDDNALEPVQSVVPLSHEPVSNVKWIVFSVLATAMAAVILGNSMRVNGRVDEINFEHEKRISELELENNILKQEMNKLRHMYTRSELDEQVQRAEFEWQERLRNSEQDDHAPEDAAPQSEVPESEPIRKVPPQDTGVKRKVVWSGDEEEPMLIVDKDYVLPAFCYNQDRAVQDDLFFEYSAKYCDVKKRKIEAKQKKAEFQAKHQSPKQDNYNKYINIKPNQQQPNDVNAGDSGRLASPFNIDYQKAFDAIKAEGSVIVEALGSILDLSPEPEPMLSAKVVEAVEPHVEAVTPPEIQQPQSPAPSASDRRPQDTREYQKSTKPAHDERREDYRKKEDDQRKSKEYGGEREKHYKEKGKGKDGRKEDGYDKRKQKYDNHGQKRNHGSEDHSGEQDRRKMQQNGKANDQHYKKRSHDDDDHDKDYRKKFESGKHGDHGGSGKHGSGEQYRRKHWDSDEGSYLEQYKRDEYRKDKRFDRDEERNGHHQRKHEGDWNDKRYKGREEYREKREGERGSGHWQERMKDGRQEARDSQRRKAEKDSNWYLERANQREEERIFQQT